MGKSNSPFQQQTNNPGERLISQWNDLDEKTLLRSQLDIAYDRIIEFILDNSSGNSLFNPTSKMFLNLKPGNVADTYLEQFRNFDLISPDPESIPEHLACFPFSMFKPGSDPAAYADLNNDIVDTGKFINLVLENKNLRCSFAPKGEFKSLVMRNCSANNSDWTGRNLYSCLIEDSDLSYVQFNHESLNTPASWSNVTIKRCKLDNSYAKGIYFDFLTISDSSLINARWDAGSVSPTNLLIENSVLNNAYFGFSVANQIIGCEAVGANLHGSNADGTALLSITRSNLKNATLNYVELVGDCSHTSFENVDFQNYLEIEFADISGSNFTGSNINDFFPDRDSIIANGCTFDETTIWVDGRPL